MDTPYATISVPMPLSVKISSRIACGMRPSITCVFLTPPSSAVRHACTLGSMPSLILPFFTMRATSLRASVETSFPSSSLMPFASVRITSFSAWMAPAIAPAGQRHNVAVDVATENHLDDFHRGFVGHTDALAELGLDGQPLEHLLNLRAAAVHDDGVEPDVLHEHDVGGEAFF